MGIVFTSVDTARHDQPEALGMVCGFDSDLATIVDSAVRVPR